MTTETIYPKLPSAPIELDDPNNYRIQKILDIQTMIDREREQRRKTLKKYKKAIKGVDVTDGVLASATVGMSIAGLAFMPIIIFMEAASIGTAALCFLTKYVSSNLKHKADKHQKILILCESKLNTIQNHISSAIEDGRITEEEFKLILEEETKFRNMVREIKEKKVDPHSAKEFEKGKQEMLQQISDFLNKK